MSLFRTLQHVCYQPGLSCCNQHFILFFSEWQEHRPAAGKRRQNLPPSFPLWHKLFGLEFTSNIDKNSLCIACPQKQMQKQSVCELTLSRLSHTLIKIRTRQWEIKQTLKTSLPHSFLVCTSTPAALQGDAKWGLWSVHRLFQLLLPP